MSTQPQTPRGMSPERAYNTAIAAAHASGKTLPEWIHPYLKKIATGEVDGDATVHEVIQRALAEVNDNAAKSSDQPHSAAPRRDVYGVTYEGVQETMTDIDYSTVHGVEGCQSAFPVVPRELERACAPL